jgi:hypothetical protein
MTVASDSEYTCGNCGLALVDLASPCPRCGSQSQSVTVPISGTQAHARAGEIGTVTDSGGYQPPRTLNVKTPLGARSEAHHGSDGSVTVRASGRPDVGTRGEPQVKDILLGRLKADGSRVELIAGAKNQVGEDGLWSVNDERRVVQVTAAPQSSSFWAAVARGSETTTVDEAAAVQWIREAVLAKRHVADRKITILAIDARHAGVLADPGIADRYRILYSSPSSEFAFAQAWIVGPTSSNCTRL